MLKLRPSFVRKTGRTEVGLAWQISRDHTGLEFDLAITAKSAVVRLEGIHAGSDEHRIK